MEKTDLRISAQGTPTEVRSWNQKNKNKVALIALLAISLITMSIVVGIGTFPLNKTTQMALTSVFSVVGGLTALGLAGKMCFEEFIVANLEREQNWKPPGRLTALSI